MRLCPTRYYRPQLLVGGFAYQHAHVLLRAAKRLLRHTPSRMYFTESGWTENVEEAKDLPTIQDLIQTCVRHQFFEVEMVLSSDSDPFEIKVPIR